ncbi:MAG TPA: matrixin family metalloprotease [Polyangia bacterium]|jgi:archaemetzincin|nr:matrixin family metalloprotease [Polyangia bacterium]
MGVTRRALLGLGLGALATFGQRRAAGASRRSLLYLQPLGGELPAEDVELVRRALTALIGMETRLLPRAALPAAAFYPPRRRYRAEKLLDFLDTRLPPDGARILGLTGVDISTTKGTVVDWGLLGLGRIDGASSVISEFRCRKKSSGAVNARERLAKVAVHEAGHTLGLAHCPNRGCLMEDAEGQVATCDREYDFCARCRGLLAAAGRPLPPSPQIPWPRPSV